MQSAERRKEVREERKSKGLCLKCGKNQLIIGITLCNICRELQNEQSTEKRKLAVANGFCRECENVLSKDSKNLCDACLEKVRERSKKNTIDRLNSNKCINCSMANSNGMSQCDMCLLKSRSKWHFGTTLKWKELKEIFDKQNGKCVLSKLDITIVNSEIDHIIPTSRGGPNTIENIQFLHPIINQIKKNLLENELFDLCKKIIEYRNIKNRGKNEQKIKNE